MSNALTPHKIAKTHKMFKVFRFMAEGESPSQACEHAGTTYAAYRKWVIDNPESVQVMQKTISAMERSALMDIAHAANMMRDQIIALANNPDLPPRTKLEVHSYYTKMLEEFEVKHGTTAREDLKAKEFLLKGPTTHKAEQKTTTVNIKPLSDGSVDVTVMKAEDIIDAIAQDAPDQSSLSNPES